MKKPLKTSLAESKPVFKGENSTPPLSAKPVSRDVRRVFSVQGQCGDKKETKEEKFRFMIKKYKWAKIYRGKTGAATDKWFVYYSYVNPKTLAFVRFKVFENINEIKDLQRKERYAVELQKHIDKALKLGYSPFKAETKADAIIQNREMEIYLEENPKSPRLTDAFEEFMAVKYRNDLAKPTIQAYEGYISRFTEYLMENRVADVRLDNIDSKFISDMLEWLRPAHKWSGTTFNIHLNFWVTLLNWFAKKPRFWVNREHFDIGKGGEVEQKTTRPMKHQYFGDNVAEKVKAKMMEFPELELFCRFIYFSCMRPDEIRNLQIENVDIRGRYIKIVGKTKSRTVPVCDELADLLTELDLDKYPANYYIFGKMGIVADTQHGENFYAGTFREKVRKPLGLSGNFTPYGFKHTRIVDLLNAGYSDAEVMNLTGHRDTASFDKYKRDLIGHLKTRLRGKTIGW